MMVTAQCPAIRGGQVVEQIPEDQTLRHSMHCMSEPFHICTHIACTSISLCQSTRLHPPFTPIKMCRPSQNCMYISRIMHRRQQTSPMEDKAYLLLLCMVKVVFRSLQACFRQYALSCATHIQQAPDMSSMQDHPSHTADTAAMLHTHPPYKVWLLSAHGTTDSHDSCTLCRWHHSSMWTCLCYTHMPFPMI